MPVLASHFSTWWTALVRPDQGRRLVLEPGVARPGFDRFLALGVIALYMFYGLTLGLYRDAPAALLSALKLPCLYALTLLVCLPPFYALNCLDGPRLRLRQCVRLLLLASSANAVALAAYTPFSLLFTLVTSREGYAFLIIMHAVVFALAALASLAVIVVLFRATAAAQGRRLRPRLVLTWGLLYAFVGTQMSWFLRPWLGSHMVPYALFRPRGGSFFEALWTMIMR